MILYDIKKETLQKAITTTTTTTAKKPTKTE